MDGFPKDATVWALPLCNTYFPTLVVPLQDKMEEDDFRMPSLYYLISKILHLNALCQVRAAAVQSYKSLNDRETLSLATRRK